ncbi:MAG: class I SAM-dependent methyltransferase [Steroidobacteraceae bacterium]
MANEISTGVHVAGQAMRFGWYFGLNRLIELQARRNPTPPRARAAGPMPTTSELLADLAQLFARDAAAVRAGLYPPDTSQAGLLESIERARAMLADAPLAGQRRRSRDAMTSREMPEAGTLPPYYAQDFHFQTGGYLTRESARLYDVQVETLFLGGAAAMRREALRPIADYMRGRDQRRIGLLDVAAGTGRFLRDVRLAWPAMRLIAVDLSQPYLEEARRHLGGLRPVELIAGAAESLPLSDASVDIATAIFLFHELPGEVRRRAAAEIARVLKPGGLFVFIDSLQAGDRPAWEGLLESFPLRFHEPYFAHYAQDDLDRIFDAAGLAAHSSWTSYLCKVVVRVK